MKIELSTEETTYLQKLLEEHRDYYKLLAGSTKCSPKNRELYKFVETLWNKLGTPI